MNILLLITCVLLIIASLFFIALVVLVAISERKVRREIIQLQREKVHWVPDIPVVERKLRRVK